MIRVGRKRLLCVALLICVVHLLAAISSSGQTKLTSRILLIPLDDRPPCLQMPVKMGLIGDAEVVAPPRAMLGRFTEFGRSDEIVEWIKKQKLTSFDAAIVSIDMIAYGGLVAMREYETTAETALKRLEIIRTIRKSVPKMPIYGSSVIMRLAPTGNVVNESYRVNLARWAEISHDPAKAAETAELEEKIPAEALAKYKKARERDLRINLHTVDLVREGVIDYLILSQDDAKPNGVHISDRETLIAKVAQLKLQEKIAIQPGADEVSMLLLSRALTAKYKYQPKIKAIFSDEKLADQFMPYEDRPLRKTVSFHIKAAGGVEVNDENEAEILFFVFVSRFEPEAAKRFSDKISEGIRRNKKFVVADVDGKGEIQGGDTAFVEELFDIGAFSAVSGYASWNTAGNTIGTALPQGLVFQTKRTDLRAILSPQPGGNKVTGKRREQSAAALARTQEAQNWFLVQRVLDDYYYHSVVRTEAIAFARQKGWNVFRFDAEQAKAVGNFSGTKMLQLIVPMMTKMNVTRVGYVCDNLQNFSFTLPWGRTFEAEIDFDLDCKKLGPPKNIGQLQVSSVWPVGKAD